MIQGQDAYESYQLEKYGVSANGEVDLIYLKRGYKSTTETAVIHYYINTKRYVQEVNNEKYHLKIGERIQLRCSSQDPELFTMVFPQENNLY
ncbi:hypothetical protein GCM10023183_14590 [Nibribacter koreensis]|uniref:Uncharacterized protein n=1 Tax=Nibribacter koreensis TaxID=1084519 RepID=A0ABP8FFT0_9BACT